MGQQLIDKHRGLYSSIIGLLMPLEDRHFSPYGELRVKCRGTIAAEFWENDTENIFSDNNDRFSSSSSSQAQKDKLIKVLDMKSSQWPGTWTL